MFHSLESSGWVFLILLEYYFKGISVHLSNMQAMALEILSHLLFVGIRVIANNTESTSSKSIFS